MLRSPHVTPARIIDPYRGGNSTADARGSGVHPSAALKLAWGLHGATMVSTAIIPTPRLGAATHVTLTVVGTVTASILVDPFGLVGFSEHPVGGLRLCGGVLVVAGMILVQRN